MRQELKVWADVCLAQAACYRADAGELRDDGLLHARRQAVEPCRAQTRRIRSWPPTVERIRTGSAWRPHMRPSSWTALTARAEYMWTRTLAALGRLPRSRASAPA